MSGKFEADGFMYSLIRQGEVYEESVFGIEHERGKGIWVFNNEGQPVLDLEEVKQLRDILNGVIEQEERFKEISGE
ncbi:hypothetical protein M3_0167 [Lysinibacillus phage vB_LfM_LysYB1]|nr:hypothetical protein M3_0167 [Lysinibacillus phage vB_LfM_LysYB1]WAB25322.1 hypothetical protein M5_0144 [Lysinibacillus phage vB_LfM_LysYB2]